ncbi:MAG: hypothetical protein J6X58_04080 [Bacteroidales bacterium]|nr:hypothetical protein [Bacteroidales bacterium]
MYQKRVGRGNYEKNKQIMEKQYYKSLRKKIKKGACAEKLEYYQLQYELQRVDYEMDLLEKLQYSITDTFTVMKIFCGKGVYEIILYSNKNKRDYEIYSPQEKSREKQKIKVGQAYKMTIVPYFNDFNGKKSRPIEIVRPVYFKGYRIIPCPISFGQIYSVENLEGLYFPSETP